MLVRDLQRIVRIVLRVHVLTVADRLQPAQPAHPTCAGSSPCNPLTGIIESYRALVFPKEFAGWHVVGASVAISFFLLGAGILVFNRLESLVLKEI